MSNIKFTPLFRLLSVALCIVMTLASVSFGVYAERDFQAEIDALESKIDANNAKKRISKRVPMSSMRKLIPYRSKSTFITHRFQSLTHKLQAMMRLSISMRRRLQSLTKA